MVDEVEIGKYTLDSLQIFFPWDDDLYTELKTKGWGSGESKTLPVIYSDNTEVTTGTKDRQRKYVIRPILFGKTCATLGWKETANENEPIIPAEKPLMRVSVINLNSSPKVKLSFIPSVNGREQYHMEYSSMAAFGKMYGNWANWYIQVADLREILKKVKATAKIRAAKIDQAILKKEGKQNQREEMDYVELQIDQYSFSMAGFNHAVDLLVRNGAKKGAIPNLTFDSSDEKARAVMEPLIKFGFVHTTSSSGFEDRNPQIVVKVSQNKITNSRRGLRAKVKGILKYEKATENFVVVDVEEFVKCAETLLGAFDLEHEAHA